MTVPKLLRVPIYGSGHPSAEPAAGDVPGGGPPALVAGDPLAALFALAVRPLVDLGLVPDGSAAKNAQGMRSHAPWGTLIPQMSSDDLRRKNIFGEGGTQ